ncbi:MAG: hypothetical protein DWQ07_01450 [Chloroflexi bacterium]|nr:MAG: hypothetical protein DWQ07_01450 [Chloroflexota bacterium]MBL1193838.1 hypothetical protein [Chloroflexota bacterium]NOH11132.1 hypothetical protein [Chloroflexota bacterium]
MNNAISQTFEDKLRAAMNDQLPMPREAFVAQLGVELTHRAQAPRSRQIFPGLNGRRILQWAVLTLLILSLLATTILGPQNIVAAMQRLLGYIPGVGFVEAERILVEPVSLEREGIIVTIEDLVATSDETILILHMENLPVEEAASYCQELRATGAEEVCLPSAPSYTLKLDEGEGYTGDLVRGQGYSENQGKEWFTSLVFPPLPPATEQVTFIIMDGLPNMYQGMPLQDWEFVLQLQPVDEGDQQLVYEVEDQNMRETILSPMHSTTDESADSATIAQPIDLQEEVDFKLSAFALSDNLLTLNIDILWERVEWHSVEIIDFLNTQGVPKGGPLPHHLTLTDASGMQVPLVLNTFESRGTESGSQKASFTLSADISGLELVSPLTLTLQNLQVEAYFAPEARSHFLFTPETTFQAGDCEPFDHVLDIYDYSIELQEVCSMESESLLLGGGGGGGGEPNTTPPPSPQYGLEVRIAAPEEVLTIDVSDSCTQTMDNCAGGGPQGRFVSEGTLISTSLYYEEPRWPIDFVLSYIHFQLSGPWSVEFDLP